jgi:hypothetical protein
MTAYQYDRRLSQSRRQMVLIILLAATMLMVLALLMSAIEWPSQPLPTPAPAPDHAPLVVLATRAG